MLGCTLPTRASLETRYQEIFNVLLKNDWPRGDAAAGDQEPSETENGNRA